MSQAIDPKYIDLAELLRDMISESEEYAGIVDEVPQSVVHMTATALQSAFESGDEEPDEHGNLYNIYLPNNYGGFIYSFFDEKKEVLDKQEEEEQNIRIFAGKCYAALEEGAWCNSDPNENPIFEPYLFLYASGDLKDDLDEETTRAVNELKQVIAQILKS